MKFCEKCGSICMPKGVNLICMRCNHKQDSDGNLTFKEKIVKKKNVEVIEKEANSYPLVDQECPKCHHKKAYFWEIQTRASDEPATQFFKCESCSHTWRIY